MKPLVVIPMAGRSTRFSAAGYQTPKWGLDIAHRKVIWWAIQSILPLVNHGAEIRFVVREENSSQLEDALAEIKSLGKIISLDFDTNGQADTVQLALNLEKDSSKPLLIWNCDSYVNPSVIHFSSWKNPFVLCSKLLGDQWSFMKLDEFGNVLEAREKVRISDYCSVGMYAFSTSEQFVSGLSKTSFGENSEMFVAPIYNSIIQSNQTVRCLQLPKEDFLSFGTPAEFLISKEMIEKNPSAYMFAR